MKIYVRPKNCRSFVVKKWNKEIWQAHLTSRDRAKDLNCQKIQTTVLKGTTAITQVTSDLVKLKNNRELTAKDIRKSVTPVIKTCTEAMTFLGHANQETDSIGRTNIAMSLPKDSYPLVKDVPIPSKWLFGDDINARINNIKAQQKAFKVNKNYFKSERILIGKRIFLNKIQKPRMDFQKSPQIKTRGTKTNLQNRHTRKQGTS